MQGRDEGKSGRQQSPCSPRHRFQFKWINSTCLNLQRLSFGRSGRRLRASYCAFQRGQTCPVDIRTAILSLRDLREFGVRNFRTEAVVPAEARDHRPPEIRIDSVLVMWHQERGYDMHTL